jgi:SAM-dependent methyltransferase
LPDASVDVAFSVFVWIHIADLEKSASEIARVLTPDGVFSIVTANPEHYDIWKSWHSNVTINGKELRGDLPKLANSSMILHTKEELEQSFKNNGLDVTAINYFGTDENNSNVGARFAIVFSGKKL